MREGTINAKVGRHLLPTFAKLLTSLCLTGGKTCVKLWVVLVLDIAVSFVQQKQMHKSVPGIY